VGYWKNLQDLLARLLQATLPDWKRSGEVLSYWWQWTLLRATSLSARVILKKNEIGLKGQGYFMTS